MEVMTLKEKAKYHDTLDTQPWDKKSNKYMLDDKEDTPYYNLSDLNFSAWAAY